MQARRLVLSLATVAVLILLAAAPVMAFDFVGSNGPDTLIGTAVTDHMFGYGGADLIRGLGGNDYIDGYGGNDRAYGGPGYDQIRGDGGNDRNGSPPPLPDRGPSALDSRAC